MAGIGEPACLNRPRRASRFLRLRLAPVPWRETLGYDGFVRGLKGIAPVAGDGNPRVEGPAGDPTATNWLDLHLREDRSTFFRDGIGRPIFYDPAARRWIVTNGDQVVALLRDPRLLCPNAVAGLMRLQRKYAVSLPNLAFAATHVPLLNEGAPHLAMRRALSRYLDDTRGRMADAGRALAERHLALLEREREIELVSDVLVPLVRDYFSELAGLPSRLPFRVAITTTLFDHWVTLKSLLAAEAELAELRRVIAEALGPAMTAEREHLIVAVSILGRDSLLATLAEGLRLLVGANPGRRMDEIAYPAGPPDTGVAIAEREAGEAFDYGGARFKRNDWIRFYFHGVTHGPGRANANLMFGTGAHACLGRYLSLDLWRSIAETLATIPRRVELVDFAYRRNRVFVMPQTVRLRLV